MKTAILAVETPGADAILIEETGPLAFTRSEALAANRGFARSPSTGEGGVYTCSIAQTNFLGNRYAGNRAKRRASRCG